MLNILDLSSILEHLSQLIYNINMELTDNIKDTLNLLRRDIDELKNILIRLEIYIPCFNTIKDEDVYNFNNIISILKRNEEKLSNYEKNSNVLKLKLKETDKSEEKEELNNTIMKLQTQLNQLNNKLKSYEEDNNKLTIDLSNSMERIEELEEEFKIQLDQLNTQIKFLNDNNILLNNNLNIKDQYQIELLEKIEYLNNENKNLSEHNKTLFNEINELKVSSSSLLVETIRPEQDIDIPNSNNYSLFDENQLYKKDLQKLQNENLSLKAEIEDLKCVNNQLKNDLLVSNYRADTAERQLTDRLIATSSTLSNVQIAIASLEYQKVENNKLLLSLNSELARISSDKHIYATQNVKLFDELASLKSQINVALSHLTPSQNSSIGSVQSPIKVVPVIVSATPPEIHVDDTKLPVTSISESPPDKSFNIIKESSEVPMSPLKEKSSSSHNMRSLKRSKTNNSDVTTEVNVEKIEDISNLNAYKPTTTKSIVICFSGINEADKEKITEPLTKIGLLRNLGSSVTHMIASTASSRTTKTIAAIVSKKWIVPLQWAVTSIENGIVLDEKQFGGRKYDDLIMKSKRILITPSSVPSHYQAGKADKSINSESLSTDEKNKIRQYEMIYMALRDFGKAVIEEVISSDKRKKLTIDDKTLNMLVSSDYIICTDIEKSQINELLNIYIIDTEKPWVGNVVELLDLIVDSKVTTPTNDIVNVNSKKRKASDN